MEQKPAWTKCIEKPGKEFPLTQLNVISGNIPPIKGTLYRNGPGRLERGGEKVGHWFDGDGAVLAVHFNEQKATAVYRYVQTKGYQEETLAQQFLYGNYGMTAPGPIWNQWFKPVKNSANTSVLALPDRLLTLWEGGQPHALNLIDLTTLGLESFHQLESGFTYSAHPKQDPDSGNIYNFGIHLGGLNADLHLYTSNSQGKLIKQSSFTLKGIPLIHDFVMAGSYLIFLIPPVRIEFFSIISGFSSYSDALKWEPSLGTQILVFNRDTLQLVSQGETDSWFQWHFGNGYQDSDGYINLDFVSYPDFYQTNQHLKEIAQGQTSTFAQGTLWKMRLNPLNAQVMLLEKVMNRSVDFPTVSSSKIGQKWSSTYLTIHRQKTNIAKERYNAIACFDYSTNTLIEADLGDNRYPSEAILVSNGDDPEQGWVLTVVYDANSHSSQIYIFDSERLSEEPVCILELPTVIPLGFHGIWNSSN